MMRMCARNNVLSLLNPISECTEWAIMKHYLIYLHEWRKFYLEVIEVE